MLKYEQITAAASIILLGFVLLLFMIAWTLSDTCLNIDGILLLAAMCGIMSVILAYMSVILIL